MKIFINVVDEYVFTDLTMQSDEQESDLWSPLPNQGRKPCAAQNNPCEYLQVTKCVDHISCSYFVSATLGNNLTLFS